MSVLGHLFMEGLFSFPNVQFIATLELMKPSGERTNVFTQNEIRQNFFLQNNSLKNSQEKMLTYCSLHIYACACRHIIFCRSGVLLTFLYLSYRRMEVVVSTRFYRQVRGRKCRLARVMQMNYLSNCFSCMLCAVSQKQRQFCALTFGLLGPCQ